jgi:hypothetical protein
MTSALLSAGYAGVTVQTPTVTTVTDADEGSGSSNGGGSDSSSDSNSDSSSGGDGGIGVIAGAVVGGIVLIGGTVALVLCLQRMIRTGGTSRLRVIPTSDTDASRRDPNHMSTQDDVHLGAGPSGSTLRTTPSEC